MALTLPVCANHCPPDEPQRSSTYLIDSRRTSYANRSACMAHSASCVGAIAVSRRECSLRHSLTWFTLEASVSSTIYNANTSARIAPPRRSTHHQRPFIGTHPVASMTHARLLCIEASPDQQWLTRCTTMRLTESMMAPLRAVVPQSFSVATVVLCWICLY